MAVKARSESEMITAVQHYTPRRSTKITLNQLLSDFANYPRTTQTTWEARDSGDG